MIRQVKRFDGFILELVVDVGTFLLILEGFSHSGFVTVLPFEWRGVLDLYVAAVL